MVGVVNAEKQVRRRDDEEKDEMEEKMKSGDNKILYIAVKARSAKSSTVSFLQSLISDQLLRSTLLLAFINKLLLIYHH